MTAKKYPPIDPEKALKRIRATLDWCVDHNQEGRRVTVGCLDCKESSNLLVGTVLVAYLPKHAGHRIWMRNPFKK